MRELRQAFGALLTVLRMAAWVVEILWLGGRVIVHVVTLSARYRAIFAEVRPCGRGHGVAQYGLWDCGCGGRFEGWVFAKCPVCGETAGWTSCRVCGLPVRNPLLP